ncbi:MAG: DUF4369 domain-containing protein [Bacteroidales bacterium]|nr:DUF4369 domain-containing protein [Bacteroidales bacterium]
MKNLFLPFLAVALFFCACNKSNQFKVTLNLNNADNQPVYLCKSVDGESVCIDSATIVNGQAVLKADKDDPQMEYVLKFDLSDGCGVYPFLPENHDMTFTGDFGNMPCWKVEGSPAMDIIMAYHEESMRLYDEKILSLYMEIANAEGDTAKIAEVESRLQPLMKEFYGYQANFIREHSDSYVSHYMLDMFKWDLDIDTVKALAAGFTSESVYSKKVQKYIEHPESEVRECVMVSD